MNQPYNIFFSSINAVLRRSLNPDPFACGAESDMQNPENTQSYNRYAYCFHNPTKYTDQSGYNSGRYKIMLDGLIELHGSIKSFFKTHGANIDNKE